MSAPQQPSTQSAAPVVTDVDPTDDDGMDPAGTDTPEAQDAAGADVAGGPDGDASDGDASDGDASDGDASDRDASDRDASDRDASGGEDLLVKEGDVAGDYLERLLDILDVDGDIDLDVDGDRASVAIVGGRLNDLIGPDGATLEALQELTRLAVAQSTGVRSRLMLDVGGFRAKRRADLTALAGETAKRVAQSGQPERLSAMNPFERKVVHDVIAGVAGVHSESEGEEPNRRVVVLPDK